MALGILAASLMAGLVGSLFGLGGGIIIIPALTLVFGLPIKEVIGASLIGVIAASTGAATRYVSEGMVNVRLGMMMEPATTLGSIVGALLAVYLDQHILAAAFAAILVYASIYMYRSPQAHVDGPERCLESLSCTYQDPLTGECVSYRVRNLGRGLLASFGAGSMSGMLGVGGGIVKVPVMNVWMGVPMRAAAATSNFMIGVTALAGAAVLYANGLISPVLAAVVAVGVFAGASLGPRISRRTAGTSLRRAFAVVMLSIAFLMVLQAAGLPVGV
ncbi:MAG: hypothetical protein A4E31_00069 [Methanomassiliicoccales archaeon PtaU1.Bin030]|nr:MAG: hypothetical protein A4E31_00069 [Methanomassiliicoccales archaeon PtaU1.Bin030]